MVAMNEPSKWLIKHTAVLASLATAIMETPCFTHVIPEKKKLKNKAPWNTLSMVFMSPIFVTNLFLRQLAKYDKLGMIHFFAIDLSHGQIFVTQLVDQQPF